MDPQTGRWSLEQYDPVWVPTYQDDLKYEYEYFPEIQTDRVAIGTNLYRTLLGHALEATGQTDVEFTFAGKPSVETRAHSSILLAVCPQLPMTKVPSDEIKFRVTLDATEETFRSFLEFVYMGTSGAETEKADGRQLYNLWMEFSSSSSTLDCIGEVLLSRVNLKNFLQVNNYLEMHEPDLRAEAVQRKVQMTPYMNMFSSQLGRRLDIVSKQWYEMERHIAISTDLFFYSNILKGRIQVQDRNLDGVAWQSLLGVLGEILRHQISNLDDYHHEVRTSGYKFHRDVFHSWGRAWYCCLVMDDWLKKFGLSQEAFKNFQTTVIKILELQAVPLFVLRKEFDFVMLNQSLLLAPAEVGQKRSRGWQEIQKYAGFYDTRLQADLIFKPPFAEMQHAERPAHHRVRIMAAYHQYLAVNIEKNIHVYNLDQPDHTLITFNIKSIKPDAMCFDTDGRLHTVVLDDLQYIHNTHGVIEGTSWGLISKGIYAMQDNDSFVLQAQDNEKKKKAIQQLHIPGYRGIYSLGLHRYDGHILHVITNGKTIRVVQCMTQTNGIDNHQMRAGVFQHVDSFIPSETPDELLGVCVHNGKLLVASIHTTITKYIPPRGISMVSLRQSTLKIHVFDINTHNTLRSVSKLHANNVRKQLDTDSDMETATLTCTNSYRFTCWINTISPSGRPLREDTVQVLDRDFIPDIKYDNKCTSDRCRQTNILFSMHIGHCGRLILHGRRSIIVVALTDRNFTVEAILGASEHGVLENKQINCITVRYPSGDLLVDTTDYRASDLPYGTNASLTSTSEHEVRHTAYLRDKSEKIVQING
jgi:hypothetical protein